MVLLISATVLGATTAGMMGRMPGDDDDDETAPDAARVAAPPDPSVAWHAEVDWRQEDGQARFRVMALRVDKRDATVVAESAPFAWPPTEDGSVEALTATVDRLDAALVDAGWSPLAPGGAWYARRFEWAPVAEPEPEQEPEPEPEPPQPRPAPAPSRRPPAARQPRLVPAPAPAAEKQSSGRFGRKSPWPEDAKERWRCEIGWAPGMLHARFEAVAYPPGSRRGSSIGRTGAVTSLMMADADPADMGHRQAVRRLAAALRDAGWVPAGRGSRWYAGRYVWRGEGDPPDELEVAPEPDKGEPAAGGAGRRPRRHEPTG